MESYKKLYDRSKKAGELRSLTPEFRKWEKKGETIVGVFVSKASVHGQIGSEPYNQYVFDTDEGRVKFSLGRASDLEVGDSFIPGVVYGIEYLGKEEIGGGRRVNRFAVSEVSAVDADTGEGEEVASND